MKSNVEYRQFRQEFRVSKEGDAPQISGYAALFNTPSENIGWIETIDPHAFDSVMKAKPDVRALWNHNPDHVLGRTSAGTLSLNIDSRGLAYSIDPPDTTLAKDLLVSMRRKDISESSFGFVVKRDQWTDNPDGSVERRILEFDELLDVSPVTYPAYSGTTAQARSFPASMPAEIRSRFERRDDDKKTKKVDGEDLTADCFLIVGDPQKTDTWHLPWKFSTDEKTKSHLRDALARFDQVEGVSDDGKKKAWNKLLSLCKKYGIDVSDEEKKSKRSLTDDSIVDDGADDATDNDLCECDCAQCRAGACGICSADPQCDNAERCKRSMLAVEHERAKMRVKLLALKQPK